jgi:hypothetical protein
MLIVNDSGTSNVVVTLYEYCNNKINPNFLWNIVRKGSNDIINFTNNDISTAPWYWNEFQITVATSSIGLTSGVIPIFEGEWLYKVYEMPTKYDLNINNSVGLLETGLLVCGLTNSTPVSVNQIDVIPVFRPSF